MEDQQEYLPVRIMKMVKELHKRGYNHLYLFSGMSPTGMSWRYIIGLTQNNKWPTEIYLVRHSVGTEGEVEWTKDNSTIESLANGFELFYSKQLAPAKSAPTEYSIWYDHLIDSLQPNKLLIFFADGPTDDDYKLTQVPGFDIKMYSKYS
ncbi:MAG: hypothetical protein K0B15_00355 [Lentimicrobium sp.]|nr:hypothetical protein [Lentimicrobium sp.]